MSSSMLPGSMGSSLSGTGSGGGVGAPCPYTTPTNPYMYHHRTTAEPGIAMSSSIATLRLKAKQHSVTSGFSSPYSTQSSSISPISRSNSGGLSACQYAGVTDTVWDNALVGTLLTQASSLNHLLSNEHDLHFDQRESHSHQNHQDESDGTNAVITDDEDCSAGQNGNVTMHDEIAD